ncbi:MAG: carboxylating nicotinate-nucleotide diphosphorylase [Candidatus Omnitrophica bacterium]|nr:carboxylating nicotinate-nucleotide diphosphorylase [Candidatus Omnitrophota bacterium]
MQLDRDRVLPIIKAALKEDIGKGDITTSALVDKFLSSRATIIANEDCVVCGLKIAEWTMAQVDYSVRFKPNCNEGDFVGKGKELAFLEGHVSSILRAERTMLNFIEFLSGITTKTKMFVDKAKPYGVKIMDTRKTYPLLRYLEKYAVSAGGGSNHRMGLYDQVLIKDNHIKAYSVQRTAYSEKNKKISLKDLVETARKKNVRGTVIEIEVTNPAEFADALQGKPDIIMLDNMTPKEAQACVEIRRMSKTKAMLEASGGINIDNIDQYAGTGIDMISIGALTHSVKSIDVSLEIV